MSNWSMNCRLFRVKKPGVDSYAIFYGDGKALYVAYNPATKTDAQVKLTTQAAVQGLELNGFSVLPVHVGRDFENAEGAGGISLRYKVNGRIIPAICVAGRVYYRNTDNTLGQCPNVGACLKSGMIIASRADLPWPKNDV